jgi:predicted ester cyclase
MLDWLVGLTVAHPESEEAMSTQANKALAASLNRCFDIGDWPRMREILAPDVKVHMTGQQGVLDLAALEAAGRMFEQAFTQSRTTIAEQIAQDDLVASRTIWTAVHSGSFNGVPPSNRTVQEETIAIDRIAGGRIVEHRGHMDLMALMGQIGAIPLPT